MPGLVRDRRTDKGHFISHVCNGSAAMAVQRRRSVMLHKTKKQPWESGLPPLVRLHSLIFHYGLPGPL